MKKILTAITILLLSVAAFAQKRPADDIVGVWKCDGYKIEIFKSGNTYSGRLLWTRDMFEADGKTPKKDNKNPDVKLRNRSRQGIVHITGLVYEDGEYVHGAVYNVTDGNTYNLKAELTGTNSLEMRGYKGIPMMGRTYKWERVR